MYRISYLNSNKYIAKSVFQSNLGFNACIPVQGITVHQKKISKKHHQIYIFLSPKNKIFLFDLTIFFEVH